MEAATREETGCKAKVVTRRFLSPTSLPITPASMVAGSEWDEGSGSSSACLMPPWPGHGPRSRNTTPTHAKLLPATALILFSYLPHLIFILCYNTVRLSHMEDETWVKLS